MAEFFGWLIPPSKNSLPLTLATPGPGLIVGKFFFLLRKQRKKSTFSVAGAEHKIYFFASFVSRRKENSGLDRRRARGEPLRRTQHLTMKLYQGNNCERSKNAFDHNWMKKDKMEDILYYAVQQILLVHCCRWNHPWLGANVWTSPEQTIQGVCGKCQARSHGCCCCFCPVGINIAAQVTK